MTIESEYQAVRASLGFTSFAERIGLLASGTLSVGDLWWAWRKRVAARWRKW